MFLCIYSDFGVLIYKGFEFFFFKIVYGPKNGLGFFFFPLKVEQIIYLFIYLRVFLILIMGDTNFFLKGKQIKKNLIIIYNFFFLFQGVSGNTLSSTWRRHCLTHQTPLFKPHEVFQMCQNFATCYSTVLNMRRYRHQCQIFFLLFVYSLGFLSHIFTLIFSLSFSFISYFLSSSFFSLCI